MSPALRALTLALVLATGCTAVVRGSPLSDKPSHPRAMYLSTGGSPRPYKTLGFIQVTGYGVAIAGVSDVGDARLDGTIRGTLADQAARMGGEGVIHIDFLDTNPQTPAERAQAAAQSLGNIASGRGGVETKNRKVIVTGEVVVFLDHSRATP